MKQYKQDMIASLVQYRDFRPWRLAWPQFRHWLLLLYWPVYGILFGFLERGWQREHHVVECVLDEYIPFLEIFVIPYMFWFVFLVGMLVFTLFFDVAAFRKMMLFVIITYTVTLVIYFIYPTQQLLRDEIDTLTRDNFLIRFMRDFYVFDTNTNVCPSIHVIGSVAVLFTAWHSRYFRTAAWQIFFWVSTVLISVSTVFLNQHSILDVIWAIPVCAVAYPFAYYGTAIWQRLFRRRVSGGTNVSTPPQSIEQTTLASGE